MAADPLTMATESYREHKLSRVLMDAGWTQAWCHVLAIIVGVVFFVGEHFDMNTGLYQGVSHILLAAATLWWLSTCGTRDVESGAYGTGKEVNGRRGTRQYWHASLWALIQHTDYFVIFMFRNFLSETDPTNAKPERAMENEVHTLNVMFLQPLGFQQSSESMVQELGTIMKTFASATDSSMFFQNGELLFWFQIYEGIIHFMIIVGSIVHLTGMQGKTAEAVVFWLYEMGMILELVTYGPAYFWLISVMWIGALWPGLLGIATLPGPSVQMMATIFATHHHVGYCLDTWGCFQITQAWGLTPQYLRNEAPAQKPIKSS